MRLKGKLLIVPFWLVEYIKVHGLNWSVLKNLLALQEHFSTYDLIDYVTSNMYQTISTSQGNYNTVDSLLNTFENFDLVGYAKAKIQDNPEYAQLTREKIVSNIEDNALVNFNTNLLEGINLVRFLSNRHGGNCVNSNDYKYVWSLFKIEEGVFGITLMPMTSNSREVDIKQTEDMVKLLLTHFQYDDVANTTLFKFWLRQLSHTV